MIISWGQEPSSTTSVKVTIGDTSQLSVAVAFPVLEGSVLALHSIVIFAGQVITGAILSPFIPMSCTQVEMLPQSSVADHVLAINVPSGQSASVVTSTKVISGVLSQLSVAVAIPVSSIPIPSPHSTVIGGGQVINGGWLSSTMIDCSHVLVFPQSSMACHVLIIVPSWGQAPVTDTSL